MRLVVRIPIFVTIVLFVVAAALGDHSVAVAAMAFGIGATVAYGCILLALSRTHR